MSFLQTGCSESPASRAGFEGCRDKAVHVHVHVHVHGVTRESPAASRSFARRYCRSQAPSALTLESVSDGLKRTAVRGARNA